MPARQKVLFVITKGNWGGAQRYVYDLATHLPADQFEPVVVSGAGAALPRQLEQAGIRTIALPGLDRNVSLVQEFKTLLALIKLFWRERPAVVHLNSSKIGGLGALAARLSPVPRIIFTVHGWPFNEKRPRLARGLIWIASWLTTLLAHQVIVLTAADRAAAARFPFCQRKSTLIANGIGPVDFFGRYDARHHLHRREPGLSLEPLSLWLGTIAELTPNKNLELLIEALAQVPRPRPGDPLGWQLVIVGEGEERDRLAELIKKQQLEDRIFLFGFLTEAARYLQAFDLFVLSSRKEGLPYVVLEAAAAGLPVIATAVGGLPDLVTDGESGRLIKPENPSDLAAALTELMGDYSLCRQLGANLKRDLSPLTLKAMAEKTIRLYNKTYA